MKKIYRTLPIFSNAPAFQYLILVTRVNHILRSQFHATVLFERSDICLPRDGLTICYHIIDVKQFTILSVRIIEHVRKLGIWVYCTC